MALETRSRQTGTDLTFEKVWMMFQETDKKFQESKETWDRSMQKSKETWDRSIQESKETWDRSMQKSKETWDRSMQESKAEHDRGMAELRESQKELTEAQKKTDEQIQETELLVKATTAQIDKLSANLGGVGNSLGDMAEGLMASDLLETFDALGLDFDRSFQNYKVKDKKTKRKLTEVDMLLVNGTIAMAVEVKTTMTQGDVDKHETRMDVLRHEPNSLFVNRRLYGAMAGVKMSKMAREYAMDKGFFVIELTGDTVKVDMPDGWTPKTW